MLLLSSKPHALDMKLTEQAYSARCWAWSQQRPGYLGIGFWMGARCSDCCPVTCLVTWIAGCGGASLLIPPRQTSGENGYVGARSVCAARSVCTYACQVVPSWFVQHLRSLVFIGVRAWGVQDLRLYW